ncbi:sorting nexin lst-4 isoform X1 [Nilaparvata lugens]|uniref:sorting nexin lst-4 isoform X1 n=1 Tax=Nilaparvata lugens TaxID=108931 RepID=UPI000B981871|nr:sorting nexin lst-4 isoform X1 [Nilaparvata lugens]
MSELKVQALYDFTGEPGSSELTIETGEILTVTRKDVGEGWWEGINKQGKTGLFPEAYVQELKVSSNQPPAIPPPPLPEGNDWGNTQPSEFQNYESVDWDDEWDDDSEGGGLPPFVQPIPPGGGVPYQSDKHSENSIAGKDNKGTVGRKNLNRFSTFVKSSGESYILGTVKLNVTEADKVYVVGSEDSITWNPIQEPYLCQVASPKKETKLKGLKSYIAYQLTPTFNNIQVSRRYKHFDWLHERLEVKFGLIPIPPLPDKQISGRYEEQFIEHRKNQLQAFVDSVCRHPVLSTCEVWEHFITCTDEKRWKAGKRKAEKDELVGANYFLALVTPEKPINLLKVEQENEACSKFVHEMDVAVRNLMATSLDQTKKHQGPYKREYQRIGQDFYNLGQAFSIEDAASGTVDKNLTSAIKKTGSTYDEIGKLFEEQPKLDWEPLGDTLHIFKGILASFPDILQVHKGVIQKRRDCEKLTFEHKMEASQLQEVRRRTDVVSYALMAEINHFHSERNTQVKKAMKSFLKEQMLFYQKIVDMLGHSLAEFGDD